MADVIVNHISCRSPQFLDYAARGDSSSHAGMFLTLDSVFPRGATEQEVLDKAAEHSREAHGMQELSPELVAKVRAAIHALRQAVGSRSAIL